MPTCWRFRGYEEGCSERVKTLSLVKLLYFLTHPIQYQSPVLRQIAQAGIDLHVVYASDRTARAFFDKGYGREFKWDVPLLDGYSNEALGDDEPEGLWAKRLSYFSPRVKDVIARCRPQVVWAHGWSHPFSVAARNEALRAGLPVMLRGDTFLGSIRGGRLRRFAHRVIYSRRFRKVSAFLAIGTLNRELYRAYGAPDERIFMLPHAVDNHFFQTKAAEMAPHREELRRKHGIEPGRPIIFFCGRLSEDKDPVTMMHAMARLAKQPERPVLLMAGDGNLRPLSERLASQLAPGSVKFLGFQNQTLLPALYDLCDVFVLPSVFEPWGLVVNEVMNAARPVVVSDKCGCWPDLVRPGVNGSVHQAGSVSDLCEKIIPWIQDAELRRRGGAESLRMIQSWGIDENIAGLQKALAAVTR